MNSREQILARISSATKSNRSDAQRRKAVENRISDHPSGVLPQGPELVAQKIKKFADKAQLAAASVDIVAAGGEARAIAKWLRAHNLPQSLRTGSDARLKKIKWPKICPPELKQGPSDGLDLVGLSHGLAGISESGTLVLASGQQNPTTINFLPENHIVVLDAKNIENDHEAVWKKIRRRYGSGKMPRTINMITGPSRSADIEQTLILGAHGPVRLHIVIVKDPPKTNAAKKSRRT
ncbi:MAG: LutC/YkgG family protein [Rhizobiaceae bacterium]